RNLTADLAGRLTRTCVRDLTIHEAFGHDEVRFVEAALETMALRSLTLRSTISLRLVERLLRHPSMRRLESLVMIGVHGDDDVACVASSPLERLSRLSIENVYGDGATDAGAEAIAKSSHGGGLRELRLVKHRIGSAG